MRHLILLCPIFCAACDQPVEYVEARPHVPAELLTACAISDRQAETWRDLAVLATEHLRSAECANGKIEAVAEIVGPK